MDTNTIKINAQIQQKNELQQKLPNINDPHFCKVWNNRTITKRNAVVFTIAHRFQQSEFLEILSNIVNPDHMLSFGRVGNKYIIYFCDSKIADSLCESGIVINNEIFHCFPIDYKPTKVVISNILPHIPDDPILDFLKTIWKV